jgi:hypothetical protein
MNTNAKKIATISGILIFFILMLGYAFFVSKDLIFGVKITKIEINGVPAESGAVFKESMIKLTGNAKNAINLTIDSREISIDQGGNFNEAIALLPGYNIINIRAKDKFGYVDEKNYKLMLQE